MKISKAIYKDYKIEFNTTENQMIPSEARIQDLIDIMRSVDLESPESILNATTISDGKGGRILL